MKKIYLIIGLLFLIGSVNAISSTDGIWGGYDSNLVYAQYCNGTVFMGFGAAHIRIYENKTGETSCNPGYHGTRFSFVIDTYTPGSNNLFYGMYQQCGFPPTLNPYTYNAMVYFYADNVTNRSDYSFPYGFYSNPQILGNPYTSCINNNTCTLRGDAQSLCYQNNYNTSFVNGTYNPRLIFIADNTEGLYPPYINFLHTGYSESFNNSVYGYSYPNWDVFDFDYVSTTITTTTTTTTTYTIPLRNITVQITDFGSIPMEDNVIHLYGCPAITDCKRGSSSEIIEPGICYSLNIMDFTNINGTKFFKNIYTSQETLCLFSSYIALDPNNNYLSRSVYVSHVLGPHEINISMNGSYNQLENNTCSTCLGFIDSITNTFINAVSFTADDAEDNIHIIGTTYSIGDGIGYCWNTSKINGLYTVHASRYNYIPRDVYVQLPCYESYIELDPKTETINQSNKYFLNGYVLFNGNGLSNQKVKASCLSIPATTNINGSFTFYKITKNSNCCLDLANVGYTYNRTCITLINNVSNFNITLGLSDLNVLDSDIYVVTDTPTGSVSVQNALITISGDSSTIPPCYTNSNGLCTFLNGVYNNPYTISIRKDNYLPFDTTIRLTDDTYTFKIFKSNELICKVQGHVYNNTIGLIVPVTLYDENNNIIAQKNTDINGFYSFDIECNKAHKLETNANGETQYAQFTVKSIGESGETLSKDFMFQTSPNKNNIDETVDIFKSTLPCLYMIWFLVLIALTMTLIRVALGSKQTKN